MKKALLLLILVTMATIAIAAESTQISLGAGSAQGALRNEETEDELELDGSIIQFELQGTYSSGFILAGRYTQFEIDRTDKDSTSTLSLTSRLTFQGLGLSGGYEFSFGSFLFQPKLTLYSGTSKVEFILNSLVIQDTGPGNGASIDLPLLYQAGKLVFGATYQSMYVGSQFEETDVVMVADSAFLLNLGARF